MGNSNLVDAIEINELLDKLRVSGFSDFVDAFLLNENKVYTKKGRLNKSGACRVLDYKPKQLDEIIANCREILKKDVLEDIPEEEEIEEE